jgi:hypothetical protein
MASRSFMNLPMPAMALYNLVHYAAWLVKEMNGVE